MNLPRTVVPETLDSLAEDDPQAVRSRRDLQRVHRAMGTRGILWRALGGLGLGLPCGQAVPLRLLELGAGDGRVMLGVAQALRARWPRVELTLLDRKRLVTPATRAAYARMGWSATAQVVDVLDWAVAPSNPPEGGLAEPWDVLLANLFVHHFEGPNWLPCWRRLNSAPGRATPDAPSAGRQPPGWCHRGEGGGPQRRGAQRSCQFSGHRAQRAVARPYRPMDGGRVSGRPVQPLLLRAAKTSGPSGRAMTPSRFDAIVIGAGVAGSTAAALLARAGWSVALVEKQRFPRRKVCGEGIAASNLPLLDALGVGREFSACAGPEPRQVALMQGRRVLTADLPAADPPGRAWGRALGRETLDSLLLNQARASGALMLQPWSVQALGGTTGAHRCEIRAIGSDHVEHLHAPVLIAAHGSWEPLPSGRAARRRARRPGDLFAFKANFRGARLAPGLLPVLSFAGGYGGMVLADQGLTTLACCIREDQLEACRRAWPSLNAGEAVQAYLKQHSQGVAQALEPAQREGPWLATGPIDPGIRLRPDDRVFRIGNAAGEAHPIIGEGMSMAMQSAWLLCARLLHPAARAGGSFGDAWQCAVRRQYAADWRRHFAPRLRLAAVLAHLAMRPALSSPLLALLGRWPGLMTLGARQAGKVRCAPSP